MSAVRVQSDVNKNHYLSFPHLTSVKYNYQHFGSGWHYVYLIFLNVTFNSNFDSRKVCEVDTDDIWLCLPTPTSKYHSLKFGCLLFNFLSYFMVKVPAPP